MATPRRYPIGAEPHGDAGSALRVWAPERRTVSVVERRAGGARGQATFELEREDAGYFSGLVPFLRAGSLYGFRLDDEPALYPDPASRFQPDGPHGPSEVIDGTSYRWKDDGFGGVGARGQVIYELHVGTFTPEGTLAAAERELDALRDLGITVIELMPLADFPGRFGWGYDGVDFFAPCRLYGRPDDLRRFVDRAHALGLGVILDVVYNHAGPDGNFLRAFSPHYFSDRYTNEWGDALNFDGPDNAPVREFFRENAAYWVDEFHFDGLRLDATQSIHDASKIHILAEIAGRVREAAGPRKTYLVAENEPQHTRLVRAGSDGGFGLDALWNDDFHHSARVAVTGRAEAYYSDYRGTPQELISALRWGYLFQGQRYEWQKQPRGTPGLDLGAERFVTYIQNHDQVANSALGLRLHDLVDVGRLKALTALLLLAPPTPMLFQGQEFTASAPFLYFADHEPELAGKVRAGRADFLKQFPSLDSDAVRAALADPADPRTFERCKLDHSERERNSAIHALHRDLLRLRRTDPAFSCQERDRVHGAVLGREALLLRFLCDQGDRLLLVNLGPDLALEPAPEPLIAPPEGCRWRLLWSSEDPRYGSAATALPSDDRNWRLPAHAALVLAPAERHA
jgi:maltooligosyltrehalose trehalohydrolase